MDAYVGSIYAFGFTFAPPGWLACDGSLQQISQYEALYTLIGTTYGGDGQSTFALRDLRGRVPLHMGQGLGLPSYVMGQKAGAENVTLMSSNMAAHSHVVTGISIPVNAASNAGTPGGNYFGPTQSFYAPSADNTNTMVPMATVSGSAGAGPQPVSILGCFTTINYCICTNGIYPTPN